MSRRVTMHDLWINGEPVLETQVEIDEDGKVTWEGRGIGRVWKGTRTSSPPLSRGSRVAKYHKQVPCWYGAPVTRALGDRDIQHDTRREVVAQLIARAAEGEISR